MSVATVITGGYGTFGDVAHVIRDGYSGNTVAPPAPAPTPDTKTGGKGDNQRRSTYKPTGLVERTLKARPSVQDRVEDTGQIQAEIAGKLARELRGEIEAFEKFEKQPVTRMSISDIDAEVGSLLRKKIRTEEEEIILLLLMAAAG